MSDLLHQLGYSLQANHKTIERSRHPDRDVQFQYINRRTRAFLRTGDPVISVDTKKKELVENFKNGGRETQTCAVSRRLELHRQASQVISSTAEMSLLFPDKP